MIDINDSKTLETVRKAIHSRDGSLVMKYIKQELDHEFSFDSIDCTKEDRIVGEEFKVAIKIKKAIDRIENFTTPKDLVIETNDF